MQWCQGSGGNWATGEAPDYLGGTLFLQSSLGLSHQPPPEVEPSQQTSTGPRRQGRQVMLGPAAHRPGSSRHNKTFTGCWTCRARKIKCDEAKPACLQCHSKALDCEGYEIRLHWLSPQLGPNEGEGGSSLFKLPRIRAQRSQVTHGGSASTC